MLAEVAESVVENLPLAGLGMVGFVALVWRLWKDTQADSRIREGYERLIDAERKRADDLADELSRERGLPSRKEEK